MVSVVIPVYKVEEYLARCVESVRSQTYKDIEIILVDDGSPDKCGEICDAFAKMDLRIKVVHKKNGGLSSARNAGIEQAKGDFICFVDSDDWIENDYIQCMVREMESSDCDLVACMIHKTSFQDDFILEQSSEIKDVSGKELFLFALKDTGGMFGGYAVNKLFRLSLIREKNVRFDENIFNGEDLPFVVKYMQYCRSAKVIMAMKYHYFVRPGSITTTSSFSNKKYTIISAREQVLALIEKNAKEYVDIVIYGYMLHLIKMKYLIESSNFADLEKLVEVKQKIKMYKKRIMNLKEISTKDRLKLWVMVYASAPIKKIYLKVKVK